MATPEAWVATQKRAAKVKKMCVEESESKN